MSDLENRNAEAMRQAVEYYRAEIATLSDRVQRLEGTVTNQNAEIETLRNRLNFIAVSTGATSR